MRNTTLASVSDHKRVADAILAGDATGAEQSMRQLLLEAQQLIEKARGAADKSRRNKPVR